MAPLATWPRAFDKKLLVKYSSCIRWHEAARHKESTMTATTDIASYEATKTFESAPGAVFDALTSADAIARWCGLAVDA